MNDLIRLAESVLGCEREKGKDNVRYVLKVNDKIVGRFKFSHSWRRNEQVNDYILNMQARSMHCSSHTWKLLLDGKLTRLDYLNELLGNGVITQEEFEALK